MQDGVPSDRLPTRQYRHVDDGLRLLLSFHGEIRASIDQLSALASGDEREPHEAARTLVDFFKGPLVWHDLDEETSLLPRLRRLDQKPHDLDEMLAACTHDHESLETYIERLMPHLDAVAKGRDEVDRGLLLAASRDLHIMLLAHLTLEEQTVFPLAARLLTRDDRSDIAREVMERREDRALGVKKVVAL